MEKRFIIGFSGRIGSGKDTAALIAKNAYPHLNFVHVAFADALKEAYTTLTGRKFLPTREFKESICPVFHVPVRDALQRIGTNALRNNFDKDIWIKILQSRYPTQNLIISDVRFLNEAAWVRKNGGTVIQIERTDQMAASIWANHESEAGVQGDFVIENDFSENGFLNFKERVERILELITGEQVAKADKLPEFTSLLDAIQYWMKEFDVLKDGKGKARDIYYKLVVEELNEAMWEEPGSQRQAEELCDLIWVTIALALCSLSPEQIQTYMKRLFTANMSKATSRLDLVQAFCYEKENLGKYDIMKSASGRYYVVDKETHKIQKGPAYEKFNLDGLF
jgi:hypothetical protein